MRALSPTASMRSTDESQGFGEATSMLSKAADDKAKAFQGKIKERTTNKKAVMISSDPESPSMNGEFVRLANQKGSDGKNKFASPSHILAPSAEREASSQEESKKEKVHFEGEMMRKAKENKLKKYWYVLEDKELYVHRKKTDTQYKTMVNLVGVFI